MLQDVGVVGWATGGGHGFATGKYGQGADNILEAEIVTPAGKVLIANQCQNQDLYWAISGGGGGTFGVITKLTVMAYPAPKVVIGGFDIRAKNQTSEDQFYKVIADAHALFPAIQDAGIHGYYTVTGPPEAEVLTFSGSFMGFDISNKTYDNTLEPFRKLLEASNSTVTWYLTKIPVSTWQELLKILPDIGTVSAGYDIRASRLISRQTVTEKTEEFAAVYKKIGPTKEEPLVQTSSCSCPLQSANRSLEWLAKPLYIWHPHHQFQARQQRFTSFLAKRYRPSNHRSKLD